MRIRAFPCLSLVIRRSSLTSTRLHTHREGGGRSAVGGSAPGRCGRAGAAAGQPCRHVGTRKRDFMATKHHVTTFDLLPMLFHNKHCWPLGFTVRLLVTLCFTARFKGFQTLETQRKRIQMQGKSIKGPEERHRHVFNSTLFVPLLPPGA